MSSRLERAKKRQRRNRATCLALFLPVMVLLAAFAYDLGQKAFKNFKQNRMQLVAVVQGSLAESFDGRALVINQEHLVQAPKPGRFEPQVKDNAKVRKGQTLGCLIDQEQKFILKAPSTGIYSTKIDGLEEVLIDPVLNAVGPEAFSFQSRTVNAGTTIRAGQPVCKIIDNLQPNILIVKIYGEISHLHDIREGSLVNLWFAGQKAGSALVKEIRMDKPVLMKLEMNIFSDALSEQRYCDVTLTQEAGRGLLVPVSALLGDDANRSIYGFKDGKIYVKKVHVVKIKGKQALVTGVELNETVVGDPSAVDPEDIVS